MNIYEKYFDKNFDNIVIEKPKNIKPLLSDDMILIAGDFYGIQKFIFEGLSTKNAAKVLRAKSAFIQIFTIYLAKYICNKLDISEDNILTSNAGKFEILSSNKNIKILEEIQEKVDKYFIENFYGLSGVSICSTKCNENDFTSVNSYKKLRENISNILEIKKFNKFNLLNQDVVLSYDENINNENLCKICNIRKGKNNCSICNTFKKLGEELAGDSVEKIKSSDFFGITFDDFVCYIKLDKKIKSYLLKDGNSPADFTTLAQNSCKDLDTGINSLAVLKADVDSMGKYLKNSDITNNFENFDTFSKTIDNFFSLYVPKLMRNNYPNSYTVFAGGDDLFLLGAWDEILELSRVIQKEFAKFIQNKLSISFGIAIIKPSYPVSRIAEHTEELLEKAKGIDDDKNAITLFGETVKWESYLSTFEKLSKAFEILEKDDTKTAFLYRLLDLIEMAKRVKYNNSIEDTIWKSKLNYSFYRNMDKKYLSLLDVLNNQMENNPKETKMFLNEFIYKRRES